jgi:hypothetical protein
MPFGMRRPFGLASLIIPAGPEGAVTGLRAVEPRSPGAEDRAANSHMRRAKLNGELEIGTHAH